MKDILLINIELKKNFSNNSVLTLAIELICLFPVDAVDVGGGICDETGMPFICSKSGRKSKDCGLAIFSWPFVNCACNS